MPPDPSLPGRWLEPLPSLHTILWSAVRSPTKAVRDRSKNIVDPLAVLVMDVHNVYTPFIGGERAGGVRRERRRSLAAKAAGFPEEDEEDGEEEGEGEEEKGEEERVLPPSRLRIPSGARRLYVCLDPDTAGLVHHVQVNGGLGNGALDVWKVLQREWDNGTVLDDAAAFGAAGRSSRAGIRSVEDIYGWQAMEQSLACEHCGCGGSYCQTESNRNVVDFTFVNVWGAQLVGELDAFINSGFHLP